MGVNEYGEYPPPGLKHQKKMLAWNYLLFLVRFCDVYGDWAKYLYSQVILCTLATSMESGMQQHYSTSPVSHLYMQFQYPTDFVSFQIGMCHRKLKNQDHSNPVNSQKIQTISILQYRY